MLVFLKERKRIFKRRKYGAIFKTYGIRKASEASAFKILVTEDCNGFCMRKKGGVSFTTKVYVKQKTILEEFSPGLVVSGEGSRKFTAETKESWCINMAAKEDAAIAYLVGQVEAELRILSPVRFLLGDTAIKVSWVSSVCIIRF